MGLGMHPLLTLDQTTYWDHDEQDYYQAYDRLFGIRQHGWLNIKLQINIPYKDEQELVGMFNKIRSLMPYLVAVTASSPFVEGQVQFLYGQPAGVLPKKSGSNPPDLPECDSREAGGNKRLCRDQPQYLSGIEKAACSDTLPREWVNSRGEIVRFTRRCLEIKAIDEQECLHSDMAICAFIMALLRTDLELERG